MTPTLLRTPSQQYAVLREGRNGQVAVSRVGAGTRLLMTSFCFCESRDGSPKMMG